MRTLLALVGLMTCLAGPVSAHSASSAYLRVEAQGRTLNVRWSIALRDLDYAVGLDADGDGAVTWGELRRQAGAIEAYTLARLRLSGDGQECTPGPVTLQADQLGDGGYAVLGFTANCPRVPSVVGVGYRLLFDLDPMHRGLLSVVVGGAVHAHVLSPDHPAVSVEATPGYGETVGTFFTAGVLHLASGIDHVLFVVLLLLPTLFQRHGGRWRMVPRLSGAFVETVKLLSMFTLAHGTTLTLSALHLVSVPPSVTEPAIIATLVLTAIDDVRRFIPGPRWMLAFAFGLIHGLGFASALGPLDLPTLPFALALLSFNLGLDAAQVGIAALLLLTARAARQLRFGINLAQPRLAGAVACRSTRSASALASSSGRTGSTPA